MPEDAVKYTLIIDCRSTRMIDFHRSPVRYSWHELSNPAFVPLIIASEYGSILKSGRTHGRGTVTFFMVSVPCPMI